MRVKNQSVFTYYNLPKQDKAKKLDDMIIFQILIMSFSFSLYAGLILAPAKSAHLMNHSMVSTCTTLHVKRIRFSYNHHHLLQCQPFLAPGQHRHLQSSLTSQLLNDDPLIPLEYRPQGKNKVLQRKCPIHVQCRHISEEKKKF